MLCVCVYVQYSHVLDNFLVNIEIQLLLTCVVCACMHVCGCLSVFVDICAWVYVCVFLCKQIICTT